jgi:predicted cupin superfamily sugar epimerase
MPSAVHCLRKLRKEPWQHMNFSPGAHSADEVIRRLRLEPLPHEGGFFRRTAEAASIISTPHGPRSSWSAILALFTPGQFSAFHRLRCDELWCFHAGDPLELVLLRESAAESIRLGPGDQFQHAVPANNWQGAQVVRGGRWSLVTCVTVPGFHWEDFELGGRPHLQREFPVAAEVIAQLSR